MGTDHVESKSECTEDTFEGSFAFVEGEYGDRETSRDIDLHEWTDSTGPRKENDSMFPPT